MRRPPVPAFLLAALALAATGCQERPPRPAEAEVSQEDPTIDVRWAPGAESNDARVNAFVRDALSACASGNYEDYRLLWRYDHQPTSRKHFERQIQAIARVDVRQIRQVVFLMPEGAIDETPRYVLHAHITIRDEYRGLGRKLQDRELVLLVVDDGGTWRFVPAIDEVKSRILSDLTAPGPVTSGPGIEVD